MDDTLRLEDVIRAFSQLRPVDVQRGARYFQNGRVSSLQSEVDGTDAVAWTARVQGTAPAPYTAYLTFNTASRRMVSSECSCPLGGSCKHCAATLYALVRRLGSLQRQEPRATVVRPALWHVPSPAPKKPAPAGALADWLNSLEASSAPEPAPTGNAPTERLVFTVTLPNPGPSPAIVDLAKAELGEAGSVARRTRVFRDHFDWTTSPVASPGDHALALRLGPPSVLYAYVLQGKLYGQTFADIVATGRAILEQPGKPDLRLVKGAPREGALAFQEQPDGSQSPTVRVEGIPEARLLTFVPPFYVDLGTGATGPVEVAGATPRMVDTWLQGKPVAVDDAASVARELARVKLSIPLPAPRVRKVRRLSVDPALVLRLESEPHDPAGATPRSRPWVRVFFDYEGQRVEPSSPARHEWLNGEEIIRMTRRSAAEARLMNVAYDAGLRPESGRPSTGGTWLGDPHTSPFLFATKIEGLSARGVIVERAPGYAFDALLADQLEVAFSEPLTPSGVAEYAVSLGIRVGDEVVDALPLVLAALRKEPPRGDGALLVPLPDGRTVVVQAARLEPLRRLLLELALAPDGAGISRVRALSLDPKVVKRSPKSLDKLRAALTSPRKASIPKALAATLRDYQRDGFEWLMTRRSANLGALLADDMGLGKTVQTLALLLAEERDGVPSLVVCPKSVLGNWEAEAARFAPTLRVHVHHGATRGQRIQHFENADVVLTTYPILARDQKLFSSMRFSTAVLDEAQTIKTRGSTFTAAACALRADFRLALSGTPMENNLGELWSILRFTLPELFGDSRTFDKVFRRPIEREQDASAREGLAGRLAPFFLRRRKEAVAAELPPKTVVIEHIPLEEAQREVYETVRATMDTRVREALRAQGLARSHIVVLDALLKLRQAVCDPRLLKLKTAKNAGSAKLTALVEKLRQLVDEGRRVLVFSQFVTMLDLVKPELRAEKIPFLTLTGQTENRAEVVADFQRGDAPVFLLSLKAGGTGLNLTAADVVIHYDPWWNPAAEEQATDRAHRIGQDKPVLVYKLVGKDTIEEKILALQERKKALFTSVLDDGAGVAKALTQADVAFLFAR